jgi:hypothetical protein
LVTPQEIKQIDRARWPFTTLRDIMRPLEDMRSVSPDTLLASALETMSRNDLNQHRARVSPRPFERSFAPNRKMPSYKQPIEICR